jgi:hypothetical protein
VFDNIRKIRYSGDVNELPPDAWFFTQAGERGGPVGFADLQSRAKEGGLNPRLDMVWTQGMPEWKPAGEVEGLFEKRAAEEAPEEGLAPAAMMEMAADRPVEPWMDPDADWPGARRRSFYALTLLFPLVWHLGFAAAAGFIETVTGPRIMGVLLVVAALVPLIVLIHISLMRFVNLGMSRWWFFGNFVPILHLWVAYRLYVCPAGYAYHKKLDPIGVILAVLFWLLTAFALITLAMILAVLFGLIANPEMQKLIEEAIRTAQEGYSSR